jgi:hypothetical protein
MKPFTQHLENQHILDLYLLKVGDTIETYDSIDRKGVPTNHCLIKVLDVDTILVDDFDKYTRMDTSALLRLVGMRDFNIW